MFASTLNTCKTFETLTNGLFLSGSDPADWLALLETDDVTVMSQGRLMPMGDEKEFFSNKTNQKKLEFFAPAKNGLCNKGT